MQSAFAACCLASAVGAGAQTPGNVLRLPLTDAGPGVNFPSDTSLGGVSVNLTSLNGAGAPTDFHGAAGTGVEGGINGSRALNFSNQTNQPGGSNPIAGTATGAAPIAALTNSPALGLGAVNAFVATIWIKQNALMALSGGDVNIGPRIWSINAGAPTVDAGGTANEISLKFQSASQLYFQFGADTVTVGPAFSSTIPTNKWLFLAVVYDGTNAALYYGTETAAAQRLGLGASANRVLNLGTGASVCIGNRPTNRQRGFNGWMEDFRFYTNAGNASFVESIRQEAVGGAPAVTSIYPDGLMLLEGTNTLSFNVASPSGTWGPSADITNVQATLNGLDISSKLTYVTNGTAGTASNLTALYTGLQANAPSNNLAITVQDAKGLIGTGSAVFDTFPTNSFIVEAEEFDFNGGQFIDNPDYTSGNDAADSNSYFGLDSNEGTDTHKGTGNGGVNASDYRAGATDGTRTQTPAAGDLPRAKFTALVAAGDTAVVDHMIGNWGSADWENYTKTFPAGNYNVYARVSAGNGSATLKMDHVISGFGGSQQTTTNYGTFTFSGSSFSTFQYAPLLDSFGNLAAVPLQGQNTFRITTGGGANANFYLFVPANTNLPLISGVYPDGTVLFQPTNKLVFTATSPTTTINTNSIHLSLNGTDVSSNLTFSGGPSVWHVTYPGLQLSQSYTVVIRVTDANGSTAASTLHIDTWNPTFQFEAEDFDFDGGSFIDNAVPTTGAANNSYYNRIGQYNIDEYNGTATPPYAGASADNYRPGDPIATTRITDAARAQFVQAGALDYNVGFLGGGFWENYTRTWPAGTYNVYARMASGIGSTIHIRLDDVTAGFGTTKQLVTNLGTFNCPGTGGYSAYLYVPLLDKYGNYANVTLGGQETLRSTVDNAVNINFYMLVPPRTDLPRIDGVYPDGAVLQQQDDTFSFTASSPAYGVPTNGVQVVLNGINVSNNLVFAGNSSSWNVSYAGLQPNTSYTAVITVTDAHAQSTSTTITFDTFSSSNFTWEAEDWDFDPGFSPAPNGTGLRFIDNPIPTSSAATNSYYNQAGDLGIDVADTFGNAHPGTYVYRPFDFVATQATSDALRQKFVDAQQAAVDPTILDYNTEYLTNGGWINYTRTYPTGSFYIYGRLSAGNGAFNMTCSLVTSGAGTDTQTTEYLGTFRGTGTSYNTWQYVPLVDTNSGQPVAVSLGGVETLQMTGDYVENANFFMLVPALPGASSLTATISGNNVLLSFPTQSGTKYTIYYKDNVGDATWTPLGAAVSGDGTVQSVPDDLSQTTRFYRLAAHN
jgi:hypothetical protein